MAELRGGSCDNVRRGMQAAGPAPPASPPEFGWAARSKSVSSV